MNERNKITIEGFRQNGSAGCMTACLANVARYLLHEDLSPKKLDSEINRSPNEDYTNSLRTMWLLQRGLSVVDVDADPAGSEQFINLEITWDQFMQNIAQLYFDGDTKLADTTYREAGFEAYIEYVRKTKKQLAPAMAEFTARGQYERIWRVPTVNDITTTLSLGGVALLRTVPKKCSFPPGASRARRCLSSFD